MVKRRLKKKVKILFISIFMLLCICGIVYSLLNIFVWKKDVDNNKKINKELADKIKVKKDKYDIDFDSLKKINSDTIAYINVPNTKIDYVVVKGNNNSFYLQHNFKKEYNIAGWIFADYRNNFDENDKNIVIFGHNTKDGSMFGTLPEVLNKKWQENKKNSNIVLVTEKKQYKYKVFSTYIIDPEDYYINTIFTDDNEYLKFLNTIKSRSNYDFNVDLNVNDKILTLSSCNTIGNKRVVLHAKLVSSK